MDNLSKARGCNIHSQRAIRLTALLAVAWLSLGGSGFGQLRTGRVERAFYQSEIAPSSTSSQRSNRQVASGSKSKKNSRPRSEVVTAAYSPSPQIDSDVAPPVVIDSAPPVISEYVSPAVTEYTSLQPRPMGSVGPLLALWYRTKIRAEAPLYWRRDQGPPPLVTTSPTGTAADIAGELGQATTETLLGGVLDQEHTTGVRLTFSTWLGAGDNLGVSLRYWNAGDQNDTFGFDSNTNPILARPYFDSDPTSPSFGGQNTQLVAFPGTLIGNISVATTSELDGLDITLRRLLYRDRFTRIDWTYGYQRVRLDERLTISSSTTDIGPPPFGGRVIEVMDSFQTENEFNGVSYGIMSTRRVARWQFEAMFRLGLGNLRREVAINGSTTTTSGGASATDLQGLLARNTNDQPFTDDTFVVIPEVGINFAYLIRPGVHFNFGYNYMLVPKVAQAAQQLDNNLAVNLSDPLTGALDPSLDFVERDYWINSLGLGFQIRY